MPAPASRRRPEGAGWAWGLRYAREAAAGAPPGRPPEKRTLVTTPREAGFFMPAEWAPHAGCWMAWPCRPETWEDIERARAVFAQVARAVAEYEPVTMTANAEHVAHARKALGVGSGADVDVVTVPSDDSWARDTAPTFLVDGRGGLAGVDWRFNAYGGLYEEYARTANMARRILDLLGARRFAAPLVLEGGAVHTDGQGTLLTTEDVVLDPRRNPDLSRDEAEGLLCAYLGAERVIWLTAALARDNTGGHVDNLAAFAAPGVVVALGCDDPDDPQAAARAENLARLRAAHDARGRRLEVVELPSPARREVRGELASPSYVNFYVANGAVLMPGFDDPKDDEARDVLARLFPRRRIVQLPTLELAKADGNIHCITQQQPAS
jgi:agmatine deiminase